MKVSVGGKSLDIQKASIGKNLGRGAFFRNKERFIAEERMLIAFEAKSQGTAFRFVLEAYKEKGRWKANRVKHSAENRENAICPICENPAARNDCEANLLESEKTAFLKTLTKSALKRAQQGGGNEDAKKIPKRRA